MNSIETSKMTTSLSDVETGKKMPETPDAPPSYATAINDAPPSYQSLYSDLKRTKQESADNKDFAQNACKLCCAAMCGSVVVLIILGVLTAIPIAMIVIGSIYLDDCPAERYIPIYLIVAGAFGLFSSLCNMGNRAKKRNSKETEEEEKAGCCAGLGSLVSCFLLAWFIAGNVWVYRTNCSPNESDINYCHPTLYTFAFWMITSTYIVMGVIFLGTICCGLLVCCVGSDA